ncbi:MAG: hypothetical protein RLZZ86_2201 [Cyanobacteriota bacterium]
MIFDSLRGVAIQDSVGINSVFPVPCSLTTQVNMANATLRYQESNRIPIDDSARTFLVCSSILSISSWDKR